MRASLARHIFSLAAATLVFASLSFADGPTAEDQSKSPAHLDSQAGEEVKKELIEREKEFWATLESKDVQALSGLLSGNAVIIYKHRETSKDAYLSDITDARFKPFTIKNVRVGCLTSDSAQVTSEFLGTDRGPDFPPTRYYVVADWVRQDNKWVVLRRVGARLYTGAVRGAPQAQTAANPSKEKQAAGTSSQQPPSEKAPEASVPTGASTLTAAEVGREEAELADLLKRQIAAWDRGDLEAFLKGYWNSLRTVFIDGDGIHHGWQAQRDRLRRSYSDRKSMGQLAYSDVEITILSPGVGLIVGRWRLQRPNGQPGGAFTMVVRKFSEGWRIITDSTETISGQ